MKIFAFPNLHNGATIQFMVHGTNNKMVDLRKILGNSIHMPAIVANSAEKILGLTRLNNAYGKVVQDLADGTESTFFDAACKHLNLRYQLTPGAIENIPKTGPCIVVANHPHGLSDGIIFGKLLASVRPDFKIIGNELLSSTCEAINPWMIKVDVEDGADAKRKNFTALKEMIKWLKNGGMIGIFPAGTASSYSWANRHVSDDQWTTNIAALIRMSQATVVPVFFPGRNSLLFQGISMINREARLAFLPREVGRDSRRTHKIMIGRAVPGAVLSQLQTDTEIVNQMRLRTYMLGTLYEKRRRQHIRKPNKNKEPQPIISCMSPEELEEEINTLPPKCIYVQSKDGNQVLYIAEAWQVPVVLREIGRLREITFRAVGEGTGNSCDIDEFDNHYKHLFLWDKSAKCIVGAYRLGEIQKIVGKFGIKGIYNANYFHVSPKLLKAIGDGLDMGRAFVTQEYQRHPLVLGLLWKGIGHFMSRHGYRYITGTVSISREYTDLSRQLISTYLESHEMHPNLAKYVKPYNPPKRHWLRTPEKRIMPETVRDTSALTQIVADVEQDGKGIPVLLRQYLKLNGKILAFNVDKDFGEVLDALILIDMYRSPEKMFKKYMGKDAFVQLEQIIKEINETNFYPK